MPEYENRTRQGLDAALRALLREKPLDQIRVRELTERCGLRRQSFYYHFKDVYDLFAWSGQRERALLLERAAECLTWQQALLVLLARMAEERVFYRAVLDRDGQEGLGELIPLEQVLEAVQTYYRERCGAPADAGAEALARRRARMDEITNIIKADLGENERGTCPGYLVTWKPQQRRTFQAAQFAKDHPAMDLSPYYKTSSTRVFTIKSEKEAV